MSSARLCRQKSETVLSVDAGLIIVFFLKNPPFRTDQFDLILFFVILDVAADAVFDDERVAVDAVFIDIGIGGVVISDLDAVAVVFVGEFQLGACRFIDAGTVFVKGVDVTAALVFPRTYE